MKVGTTGRYFVDTLGNNERRWDCHVISKARYERRKQPPSNGKMPEQNCGISLSSISGLAWVQLIA